MQQPATFSQTRLALCVAFSLCLATLVLFWPALSHEFVNFDDDKYIVLNEQVRSGVTMRGAAWAFTTLRGSHWHPLTWLSHMLDCQIYGLNAGGHHLTSLLLHAANSTLFFLLLRAMTRELWPSAFAAFWFALHPLRVESVAWAAERKDVLCAWFWFLAMGAYIGYARLPSWKRFGGVIGLYALGLMSKPMLVSLPFALLLLDYWPLGRLRCRQDFRKLLLEKIPLLALALVSSAVTLVASEKSALMPLETLPLLARCVNAVISYVAYLWAIALPWNLTVFYPHPGLAANPFGAIAVFAALVAASFLAYRLREKHPYIMLGWFWFLITLAPVIGIIQVGLHSRADRYTYIPHAGLAVALAWTLVRAISARRFLSRSLTVVALVVLLLCSFQTRTQLRYWQNSESLWTRALTLYPGSAVAHLKMGDALREKGELGRAIEHYRQTLALEPGQFLAHGNLALALAQQGDLEESARYYRSFLQIRPTDIKALFQLGDVLMRQGKVGEAVIYFENLLRQDPLQPEFHNSLGIVYFNQGRLSAAEKQFREALKLNAAHAGARSNLERLLRVRAAPQNEIPSPI
ncbi:MAG: tetratricopeptide repeat protein [Elusimicrobia bacterium]|nr:tetratricopeptide repeat protein [Elusimicrobiota bacterium]